MDGVEYRVLETARNYREQGIASWYGSKFHGRATANGEIFDAYAASAAHRSLPLPTFVRVTNLENQLTMILKVNDRGPFHSQRWIDLSYGAAVKLGFTEQGTTLVEVVALQIEGVEDLRNDEATRDWQKIYRHLQLGAFRSADSAEALNLRLINELGDQYTTSVLVETVVLDGKRLFRTRVGPLMTAHGY